MSPDQSMRVADWLAVRTPPPPATLAHRLAEIAGTTTYRNGSSLFDALLETAAVPLRRSGNDRKTALDLLVADALISYALEAAADSCSDFPAMSTEAIRRMAQTVLGNVAP